MYRSSKEKMCYIPIEKLDDSDYRTYTERSMSTGSKEKWTRFSDGTSIYHGGAMAEDTYYDEHGEEC